MRCYICDYSDDGRSYYHFSLVDPKGSRKRYVLYDKTTDKEICNYCLDKPLERKAND